MMSDALRMSAHRKDHLMPARRWLRRLGPATTALVAAGLLLGATPSPSGGDQVPTGVVTVDGQQTPILGRFVYHEFDTDTNPEVRGLVHGVRRVDGGTVLYYSIGSKAAGDFDGSRAFPNSSFPYELNRGVDLALVDTHSLAAYRPLWTGDTTFASDTSDLDSKSGELRVGWAVFPELPADVATVQVVMPWGTAAGEVPVEDGALEPVSKEPAPYVGAGWPSVPQGSELSGADTAAVTFVLARRSSDLAQTAQVVETPQAVAVTLDANVLFASGSAELSPEAQQTLAAVAADIKERGTGEVVVTGHTDSDGSDAFNQTLSEQRATAVVGVLQPSSGSGVTFTAVGKGEAEPVAPNDTDEGKQANRRVTVVYSVQGAK